MGLCRLCLTDSIDTIDIFGEVGIKHSISQTLSEYFWFHIVENDAISTMVCQKCWFNTSTFQDFHHSIKLAQQSLYKQSSYMTYSDTKPSFAADATDETHRDPDCIGGDINAAGLQQLVGTSDGHQHLIETGPSTSSAAAGIGMEMYEPLDVTIELTVNAAPAPADGVACKVEPADNELAASIDDGTGDNAAATFDVYSVSEHSDSWSDDGTKEARKQQRKQAASSRKTKLAVGAETTKKQPSDENEAEGDEENYSDENYSDEEEDDEEEYEETSSANADNDDYDVDDEDLPILPSKSRKMKKKRASRKHTRAEEDARIRSVCNIYCNLCLMSFDTFCDLSKHYRLAHDRKGFVVCCDRKMTTRSRLLEHIETHLNPDAFQCTVCDARFSGRFPLKKHMDTHVADTDKPFACDECPNRYTKAVLLSRHRFNVHSREEDKKFVCEVCDKKYLSAGKLAEHVKRSHEFVPEICDFCGKEFKSIYNLNVHRTEVHMGHEVPRMQCNICGTWLREKYLKKHLKRHNAEVETCTVCGKTLQNKNSLGNHMRNVHGNRMHQCAVCGKTFSKPLSLREHMALHTGQDLYTCPYCPKTFKSGANMHSHRKKFHFEDWSKDRGKRLVTSNYL